jgi:hypothetical protein
MSFFDASIFELLFDFAKERGESAMPKSPIEYALINNKQFVEVSGVFFELGSAVT